MFSELSGHSVIVVLDMMQNFLSTTSFKLGLQTYNNSESTKVHTYLSSKVLYIILVNF
jgi:hypothetical protein